MDMCIVLYYNYIFKMHENSCYRKYDLFNNDGENPRKILSK